MDEWILILFLDEDATIIELNKKLTSITVTVSLIYSFIISSKISLSVNGFPVSETPEIHNLGE